MEITCDTVELRLVSPREAQQLHALAREEAVSRYLQWRPYGSIEDAFEYIADARRLWRDQVAWLPGIFERESQQLVGCISLSHVDMANRRVEVGTWLGLPWQRRGFNLPAKAAALHAAFDELGMERAEFLVRADNQRSIASMRALPSVREEGLLARRLRSPEGDPYDAVLFAVLADEFRADRDAGRWPAAAPSPASPRLRGFGRGRSDASSPSR